MVAPADVPVAEWADVVGKDFDIQTLLEADFRPDDPEAVPGSRLAELRAIYASDRFRLHATKASLDRLETPFFVFTYFRGIDIANHDYAHQETGSIQPLDPPDVVARYYEIVDRWIGEIWQARENTIIAIVSDHGFDEPQRFAPNNAVYRTGSHSYAPYGVFIVAGGDVKPGYLTNAHVFDVAPTLLALFRVPNLATVEGRVLEEVSEPSVLVNNWADLVPTSMPAGNPALSDPALLKRLKALGYIR